MSDNLIHILSTNGILFILSLIFWKFPPKKINGIYGYRTAKAMQNDNIWQFANSTFNAAFLKYSLFSLLGGLLLSTSSKLLTWEPMVLVMLSILVAIVKTERALSDKFTDDGKEK